MRRSRMVSNLLMMLEEKVIVIEELDDFSEELKEEFNLYFRGQLMKLKNSVKNKLSKMSKEELFELINNF